MFESSRTATYVVSSSCAILLFALLLITTNDLNYRRAPPFSVLAARNDETSQLKQQRQQQQQQYRLNVTQTPLPTILKLGAQASSHHDHLDHSRQQLDLLPAVVEAAPQFVPQSAPPSLVPLKATGGLNYADNRTTERTLHSAGPQAQLGSASRVYFTTTTQQHEATTASERIGKDSTSDSNNNNVNNNSNNLQHELAQEDGHTGGRGGGREFNNSSRTNVFKSSSTSSKSADTDVVSQHYSAPPPRPPPRRPRAAAQELNPDCEFQGGGRKPTIYGLRCDEAEVTDEGAIVIRAFTATRVYLIGRNLYSNLTIALTEQDGAPQDDCTHADRIKSLRLYNLSLNIGEIVVELPPPEKNVPYYFCIREDSSDARWYHQGSEAWLKIQVEQDFMPLWAKIVTIAILLSMSGLFSGLNLGLMALDKNELQVIMKCGSDDEKRYATIIEPVRRRGNYLLCSILFSNTLVNSTISVFLEDLSDGLVAIMTSTVLIVLFGEILPQAFCSRHGLAVGAKTIWLTNFCMFITFPLSYPVSYCLDWALGEEIGHAYDRERLMEFIQVTRDINNLEADEVNIISGALKIKRVQISEVMTRIEDVYMLDENALLDFDTIQAIVGKGYSRIPVHESGNRRNIKAVLFAKDLALVDPDDRTPVQTMINFFNHPRMFVFEDTTLDKALNEFKTGKSHMAIVQRVQDDGDRDPYYEVTGIVTLEDVIEEIMQMEINDETDTLTDNRRKRRRKDAQVRQDFSQFTNLGTGDSSFNVVTPQLCLAAYQYLASTVEPFTPKFLSDSILRRLLSQKIFYKVRLEDDFAQKRLYTAGEPADYFIMILEGRVHVICGKENLFFDGGPFSFFGKAALTQIDQSDALQVAAATGIAKEAAANVAAGLQAPTTPGGTQVSSLTAPSADPSSSSKPIRRDSTRPVLSRRESLAKMVTSQLSLAPKKVADVDQQQQQQASSELSPTNSAKVTTVAGQSAVPETVELLERGSYYFKPDYTVDVIANTSYLKVTRNDYITALRATCVERESAALLDDGDTGQRQDSSTMMMMIMDNSQMFSAAHEHSQPADSQQDSSAA